MRCKDCGLENPSGQYKCVRCGHTFLPPLPAEIYTPKIHGFKKVSRRFLITLVCGLLSLTLVSVVVIAFMAWNRIAFAASFTEGESSSLLMADAQQPGADASVDLEESQKPAGSNSYSVNLGAADPEQYIENGIMTLPGSTITIGIPAYETYHSTYNPLDKTYSFKFYTQDNMVIEIFNHASAYSYTKSEEEDYFKSEYGYLRLEGTEKQYYYSLLDGTKASAVIVDLNASTNYYVLVYCQGLSSDAEAQEGLVKAETLLNREILDKSSLALQEESLDGE